MPHTIIYNPETHIIETKFQGTITINEMKELLPEILQIAIEKETFLALSDFSEAIIGFSITDIYNLPKVISDTVDPLKLKASQFKRAIVTAKDFKHSRFAEDVNINRGLTVKFFYDIEEARKWLSESSAKE